jgi:lipopolysaccharide transport system permease protein
VAETKPYLTIQPKKGWQLINFKELLEYRDLLFLLISRNIKVRYKQTVLGGLWAIIQPFLMMVVFSVFFGLLAKVPSDGIPYPIFNYAGLIAWTYFANSLTGASNSLVSEAGLVSKVYFPRMIAPLAPIFANLLDFAISFVILIGMMFYFHVYPNRYALLLPFLVILVMFAASGAGMFLAALNAKYRDIQYTVPFLIQFWMFASPIVYPVSMLPEKYHLIYAINPMVGVIEGFRSALLGTVTFPTQLVLVSVGVSIILFIVGALYFKRTERFFADIL